jgi:hypothetical protein
MRATFKPNAMGADSVVFNTSMLSTCGGEGRHEMGGPRRWTIMAFGNETLHVKHLRNGKRHFNVIDEDADCLLLQDQDTGVYWNFNVPLSLGRIIDAVKKERGTVIGRVLISEMQADRVITLKWTLR